MISRAKNFSIDNQVNGFDVESLPLEQALAYTQEALKQTFNITLVFIDSEAMFILNNQLRQKPGPTDILSLPFSQYFGEIYICPEYIFQQGYTVKRIIHLWIHGLLHIAGFTHDDDQTFKEMSQYEVDILKKLNITDPYHENS